MPDFTYIPASVPEIVALNPLACLTTAVALDATVSFAPAFMTASYSWPVPETTAVPPLKTVQESALPATSRTPRS